MRVRRQQKQGNWRWVVDYRDGNAANAYPNAPPPSVCEVVRWTLPA